MTKIIPFKAVIYNQEKIKDLSEVVCPPYDIISPAAQEKYLDLSPYNIIHLLLRKDTPGQDKYAEARRLFREWLASKIIIQDQQPVIYFYHQQYCLKGERLSRLGFIALLKLEDTNVSVFGHEHTRLEPKEDRLRLLQKVKANLSPIFAVFSDHKRIIQRTYEQHIKEKKPFIDLVDDEKTNHKLWRIDSENALIDIQNQMRGENIFIADGHHRYEVACVYRQHLRQRRGLKDQDKSFDYILTYFTNTASRGLTILPIHRLVKLAARPDTDALRLKLKEYFDVEEIKDKVKFLFLLQKAGSREHVIGLYQDKKYWLLRLKNIKILDKAISDKPPEYRSLDVSLLNRLVLKKILGVDTEDKESVVFSHDADELIRQADADGSSIAFLLNPVKIGQIISVALKGEKIPAKSTYFYPKVLSGLVINKFD